MELRELRPNPLGRNEIPAARRFEPDSRRRNTEHLDDAIECFTPRDVRPALP